MNSLKFTYFPNSNISIKVKTSNILRYYSEFLNTANKYIYELEDHESYSYLINLSFRPCVSGEIFIPESNMLKN